MRKRDSVGAQPAHVLDQTSLASERMEAYCTAHPRSASALYRPRLLLRGQLWVALLGPNIEEGIVGIGPTIEAALHAFDDRYPARLHPSRRIKKPATLR
jgi:hypothetical protein